MNLRSFISVLACISLGIAKAAHADPGTVSGGIIVPVVDPNGSDCIDVTKQSVSMLVLDLKAQRYSSWFSETKNIGVKIDVTMLGPTGPNQGTFSFPRALSLTPVGKGDVLEIPVHQFPILTNYNFSDNSGNPYSNVGLDVSFIDITGSNSLSSTITSLISFTKSLPIPANPYEQGVQYFGNFVSQLQNSESDPKNSQALAAVNNDLFAGNGTCKATQLHEGTYAILYDFQSGGGLFVTSGNRPDGVIDVSTIASGVGPIPAGQKRYCFYLTGGSVSYAEQGSAVDCSKVTNPLSVLNNPQVVIETIAYDMPQKTVAGQHIIQVTPSHLEALSNLSGSDINMMGPQRELAAIISADIKAGKSFDSTILRIGGSNDTKNTHHNSYIVSPDASLALANARAIARCKNVGINPKLCVINKFTFRS
ncbi:hypothetical protein [Novosphingobium sp. FSW06-99]|uniref:hypothetical protein n=1 Tax=Novosphingobium sp. FSW06-99 TaxID=1739113 RepID=UPI000A90E07A|nr:hypothetical protein [Novosphingobium sp. FSW06-99]